MTPFKYYLKCYVNAVVDSHTVFSKPKFVLQIPSIKKVFMYGFLNLSMAKKMHWYINLQCQVKHDKPAEHKFLRKTKRLKGNKMKRFSSILNCWYFDIFETNQWPAFWKWFCSWWYKAKWSSWRNDKELYDFVFADLEGELAEQFWSCWSLSFEPRIIALT